MEFKKTKNMQNAPEDIKENERQEECDDSGYELDDSGMIPKLEELKAAGKKKEETTLGSSDKTISFTSDLEKDGDLQKNVLDSEEESPIDEKEVSLEDIKKIMEDERYSYINKNNEVDFDEVYYSDEDDDLDEDDILYLNRDEKDLDQDYYSYDEKDSIEKQKIFSQDQLMYGLEDDLSDLKVDFYDEDEKDSLSGIVSALEKIADRSSLLEILSDREFDIERIADSLDRIADSLDRIADSLEFMEK